MSIFNTIIKMWCHVFNKDHNRLSKTDTIGQFVNSGHVSSIVLLDTGVGIIQKLAIKTEDKTIKYIDLKVLVPNPKEEFNCHNFDVQSSSDTNRLRENTELWTSTVTGNFGM